MESREFIQVSLGNVAERERERELTSIATPGVPPKHGISTRNTFFL